MSRNIGAVSKIPADRNLTYGMLYQWGRKDPFVATNAEGSSTPASTYPPFAQSGVEKTSASGTVQYSVANPTAFIKSTNKEGWLYNSDKKLWGATKTMYDPCPAGWRVPDKTVWEGWPNVYLSSYPELTSNSYRGYIFTTNYSYPETWYPMTGHKIHSDATLSRALDIGSFTYGGVSGSWSNEYPYHYVAAVYSSWGLIDYTYRLSQTDFDCGDGLPVRCQKEK